MSTATTVFHKEPFDLDDTLYVPESWTMFWDLHTGGETKLEPYNHIFVNLDEKTAIQWFKHTTGRDPFANSCRCCGNDYAVDGFKNLDDAARYHYIHDLQRRLYKQEATLPEEVLDYVIFDRKEAFTEQVRQFLNAQANRNWMVEHIQAYFDRPDVLVVKTMAWLPGINNLEA